jgi:SPP1 gp7 family putative phage head morphogenesis protein
LEPARAELAAIVRKAAATSVVDAKLAEWAKTTQSLQPLRTALLEPSLRLDLAGQLMVRSAAPKRLIKLARGDSAYSFLDLPWADALEAFLQRVPQRRDELQRLYRAYSQRADVATQMSLDQLQSMVRERLAKHIEEGGTFEDFAKDIEDGTESLGITKDDPAYLQMVFRTNVQSAYGAGRFRALTDPDVIAEYPYVQYRTVGDARVREEHQVLDRGIYAANNPAWFRIAPPNGFQCRCSTVPLSADDAQGKTVLQQVPPEYKPTREFNRPPVAPLSANDNSNRQLTIDRLL